MERTLAYTWLLLVAAVATLADTSEDYLPRSIRPNEDSMSERPPAEEETPLSFAASLKPLEFQYLVSLDAPEKPDEEGRFRYDVDEPLVEEEPQQEQQQPTRAEIEAVLKKYFGSKSKYVYDKDQVGIPGKANRYRRSTSSSRAGASSSSSSSASASASSSSFNNDGPIFYDQGFSGFNMAGFGDFGGLGGSPQDGANFGGGINQGYGGQDGLHSRFGGSDDSGTRVRGVYSGASSSIDSNGKTTYVVKTGKF